MRKTALTLGLFFLCGSLVYSQSLIEIAAKEKARRKAIRSQGKSASVVTNAHLRKYPKSVRVPSDGFERPSDEKTITTQPKRPVSPVRVTVRDSGKKSGTGFQAPLYATKILPETRLVENPAAALKRPDGSTADICLFGILDLEIDGKNGPGDDIAIFLHRVDGLNAHNMQSSEGIPMSGMGFQYWGGYWYGVLGLGEKGDWMFPVPSTCAIRFSVSPGQGIPRHASHP